MERSREDWKKWQGNRAGNYVNEDQLKRAGEEVRAGGEEWLEKGEGDPEPPDLCAHPSGSPRGTTRHR
jgi:hypothetical protein